jgi:membrane protein
VASLKARIAARIAAVRRRRPFVDHLVRMQEHYGAVKAGQQAGAVTYFAFLSFFPIMALSFFVIGYVAEVYPAAQANLVDAIKQVLPGLLGPRDDQISIADVQSAAGTVGLIGLAGVLYSGLGWLSAMRDALIVVFELPAKEQPNFVLGKLRDLITLALVGVVLIVSVALTGLVSGFSDDLLDWLGLGSELGWLVKVVTIVLGLAANMVLFFAMFKLLAGPHAPARSLWSGALLGAVGFEVLKQASQYLLGATKDQPAFQAFGIALILLVWINYFSRVVLYAAAFAHTSRAARAARVYDAPAPLQGPPSPGLAERRGAAASRPGRLRPFAAGGAVALALAALVRRRRSGRAERAER